MHLSEPPPDPRELAPERDIPRRPRRRHAQGAREGADAPLPDADEFADALRGALAPIDGARRRCTLRPRSASRCAACGAHRPARRRSSAASAARASAAPRAAAARARRRSPPSDGGAPAARRSLARALPLPVRRPRGGSRVARRSAGSRSNGLAHGRAHRRRRTASARRACSREFLRSRADRGRRRRRRPAPIPGGPRSATTRSAARSSRSPASRPTAASPTTGRGATPEARRGLADIFGRATPREPQRTSGRAAARAALARRRAASSPPRRSAGRSIARARRRAAATASSSRSTICTPSTARAATRSPTCIGEPPLAAACSSSRRTRPASIRAGARAASTRARRGLARRRSRAARSGRGLALDAASAGEGDRAVPPLYVDQLIRFTIEGGSDPPARLADLIALRIERLPPDARRVLQALAVLGDEATPIDIQRCSSPGCARTSTALVTTLRRRRA